MIYSCVAIVSDSCAAVAAAVLNIIEILEDKMVGKILVRMVMWS